MSKKAPVKAFEMYLIRHGETSSNAGKPRGEHEHAHDPGLTERGKCQAALVGKRMAALALDKVFASGLERAVETAAHIAAVQPEGGSQTVNILPILCETGVSEDYEGHPIAYFSGKYAAKKADGVEGDKLVVPSGSSDDAASFARGEEAIRYFTDRFVNGEKIAVVAHGAFNTFILLAAMSVRPENMAFDFDFFNTGVTRIVFYDENGGIYGEKARVAFLNDTSHLYEDFPGFCFYDDPAKSEKG